MIPLPASKLVFLYVPKIIMDFPSTHELGDVYMASSLSVLFVAAFVCCKPCNSSSEKSLRQSLIAVWAVLELAALALSLIHDFSELPLPRALGRSLHLILVTISMCGVANVQVSRFLYLTLAAC